VTVHVVCSLVVVQTLVTNCELYASEHRDYETICQFARNWLTMSRDQLSTCLNVSADQQCLEAAKNVLMVTAVYCLLMIVGSVLS